MADVKQLTLEGGKYRFFTDEHGTLYCERYGKPWREFLGDKAVSALFEAAAAAAGCPLQGPGHSPEPPAAGPPAAGQAKKVILRGQPWLVRDDGYRFWIGPAAGNPVLDRDDVSVLEYKHEDQGGQWLARLMFNSLPDTPGPADGGSGNVAPPGNAPAQPAARQVAEWLFDYESLLNSLANQFRVTRDEDLESTGRRLEERAEEVQAVAARLYDQKGVVRDSGYQDLLLREAMVRLECPGEPHFWNTAIFPTTDELCRAILRHTTP